MGGGNWTFATGFKPLEFWGILLSKPVHFPFWDGDDRPINGSELNIHQLLITLQTLQGIPTLEFFGQLWGMVEQGWNMTTGCLAQWLAWHSGDILSGKGSYERVTSLKYVGEGHGSISKDELVTSGASIVMATRRVWEINICLITYA